MGKQQASAKRKRANSPILTQCTLSMRCDWVDCDYEASEVDEFISHVEKHEAHVEARETNNKQQDWFCCMWESCGFSSLSSKTTRFHINYHGFHTRIKAVGVAILHDNPDLDCHQDLNARNILPILPEERKCEWISGYCQFRTDSYQRLLDHANTHVTGQPRRRFHQIVHCGWGECDKPNKSMSKLKNHLRSHTQEKRIACPVCGIQFVNSTKFVDHCKRQAKPLDRIRCSYCKKTFPSERILQDHYRAHIQLHKCPMCDMTCPYRSALALHIRYRHLKDRPFGCTFCDHRATTERDLKTHYLTHCDEKDWVCYEADCDFRARSKNGLTTHLAKAHGETTEYACHICDERYPRGAALTVHLRNVHDYRWASGQSRFRYYKDESGIHRLQTIRVESLEVAEQIISNATIRRPDRKKRFSIVNESPNSYVIQEERGNGLEDDPESESDEDEITQISKSKLDIAPVDLPSSSSQIRRLVQDNTLQFTADGYSEVDAGTYTNLVVAEDSKNDNEEIDEFSESLKEHIGIRDGFIRVVKDLF